MSRSRWCSFHLTGKPCWVLVYSALLVAHLFRYVYWGGRCQFHLAEPASSWLDSQLGLDLGRGSGGVAPGLASPWRYLCIDASSFYISAEIKLCLFSFWNSEYLFITIELICNNFNSRFKFDLWNAVISGNRHRARVLFRSEIRGLIDLDSTDLHFNLI